MTETPWEPPLAGNGAEQLVGALERQRWTFRWKADGLDEAGLRARIGSSALTIGGLIKHLALVEDHYFGPQLDGSPYAERWDLLGHDGDEFTLTERDTPAELYALWDRAVDRSRKRLSAALAAGDLGQLVRITGPEGQQVTLRRLICDLLEEYARHTGHTDLLREAVDGRVGEDPPAGWRPVS